VTDTSELVEEDQCESNEDPFLHMLRCLKALGLWSKGHSVNSAFEELKLQPHVLS